VLAVQGDPLTDKSRAFLFLESDGRVYRCQLTKAMTLIGSAPENDIVIHDESVHARHAQVSCANNSYTLRPLECTDLKVDGEDVEGRWELANGQQLHIGELVVLFGREQKESSAAIHLLIRRPNEPPMGFWTTKSTLLIGREKGDLILDDPQLSRVHTVIENFCEQGQFLLDARSESGTSLNGELINSRRRLKDGDLLQLGAVEIEFRSQPFESPSGKDAAQLLDEFRRNRAHERPLSPKSPMETHSDPVKAAPRSLTNQVRLGLSNRAISPDSKEVKALQAKARPPLVGFGDRRSELDTRLNQNKDGLWYLPPGESEAIRVDGSEGKAIIKAARDKAPEEPIEATVEWDRAQAEGENRRAAEARRAMHRAKTVPPAGEDIGPGARLGSEDRWYVPEGNSAKAKRRRDSHLPWYLPANAQADAEIPESSGESDGISTGGQTRAFGDD
jgi:pSer/pThr/pTyr-binding forkhead associated (FHA) protein